MTVSFIDVLPRLQSGVLVAFHDISLPDDYPNEWSDRWYNGQYLLAAFLLGAAAGPRWSSRPGSWPRTRSTRTSSRNCGLVRTSQRSNATERLLVVDPLTNCHAAAREYDLAGEGSDPERR